MNKHLKILLVVALGAVLVIVAIRFQSIRSQDVPRAPAASRVEKPVLKQAPGGNEDRISAEATENEKRRVAAEKKEAERREWYKSIGLPDGEGTSRVDVHLGGISGTLGQYYQTFNEWPQGNNREVAAALLGENPKKTVFLGWHKSETNSDGELLDPWKTPYYIQITGDKIEIRSAGPNRLLWDEDDKVVK
ncbi:MAG: hypothetical protein M3463_00540 [Verrucomicrobiota bacterium]|nr:hypothetical protein [Verrucomicrobiota bacterium]